jgi:hypothetical protein
MRLPRPRPLVRSTLLTGLLAGAFLSACDKNPVKPTPAPPARLYPVLATPQDVLSALQLAYIFRDSLEYKALHDSAYAGTSQDAFDPPGTPPLQFTFADEAAHIAKLARTNTITSARLDFGPPSGWNRLPSDDLAHPDWAIIQIPGSSFQVQIVDRDNVFSAGGSTEFLEFKFQPTAPDTTSPTDTTWKIVRWQETRSFGP